MKKNTKKMNNWQLFKSYVYSVTFAMTAELRGIHALNGGDARTEITGIVNV